MKPTFLWVTDPWETLDHPNDTTLRLAQESLALGYRNFWCDVRSVRWDGHSVSAAIHEFIHIHGSRQTSADFRLKKSRVQTPASYSKVVYRTDPPVDLAYLHPLLLLDLAARENRRRCELINRPEILCGASEKLEAGLLMKHGLMPETFVSSEREPLLQFGRRLRRAVLKPMHECQSKGVELLRFDTSGAIRHAERLLKDASDGFQRPVLLQRFLPGISKGEQRLWFLDGRLLAAARKLPKTGEFRIDMDRGGSLVPTRLSPSELRATRLIGRHLASTGIRMAAVDLIQGKATDFNFTSPGLLVQMEGVTERNLARKIIERLAKRL